MHISGKKVIFYDFMFYKSEIRTVLLEVGIVLGLLKKNLKLAKLFSFVAIHLKDIFRIFQAKCLLPSLNRLLPVRS